MNRVYLVLICLCCAFCARSQVVAVKTNVLYDALRLQPGAEVAFDETSFAWIFPAITMPLDSPGR